MAARIYFSRVAVILCCPAWAAWLDGKLDLVSGNHLRLVQNKNAIADIASDGIFAGHRTKVNFSTPGNLAGLGTSQPHFWN